MSNTTSLSTPKYRRYKEDKARRVFTAAHESRHLIVENVSKPLCLSSELLNAFAVHGDVERFLLLLLPLLLVIRPDFLTLLRHCATVIHFSSLKRERKTNSSSLIASLSTTSTTPGDLPRPLSLSLSITRSRFSGSIVLTKKTPTERQRGR